MIYPPDHNMQYTAQICLSVVYMQYAAFVKTKII